MVAHRAHDSGAFPDATVPRHRFWYGTQRGCALSYNLAEAGKAIGMSKSSVLRAIRRGAISASRDELTGGWAIDPAELHRVFAPVASGAGQPLNGTPRNGH